MIIHQILSSMNKESKDIIGTPYHSSWIMFTRSSSDNNNYSRVITYINIKLISLRFLLIKDIFNHYDINLILFFNHDIICFILNIYSNDQQNVFMYLKNTEVNLNNIIIMTEDFNIRNNDWDLSYSYYLLHTDILC